MLPRASGPQHTGASQPCRTARATVVATHPNQRTVDVELDNQDQILYEIEYGTPYACEATGTFIDFVPEPGACCYVMFPSDGTRPLIISWVTTPRSAVYDNEEEPVDTYVGGRLGLVPGDLALYNSKGAFVILRHGGTLQIGASPLAQTMYVPVENLIRHFFQNYEGKGIPGEIHWKHGAMKSEDDKTTVQLFWGTKQFAEDQHLTMTIRAGRAGEEEFSPRQEELFGATKTKPYKYGLAMDYGPNGSNDPEKTTILSICVDPDNTGCTYVYQLDSLGNVFHRITGSVHWELESVNAHFSEGFHLHFGSAGSVEATAAGILQAKVQQLIVEAAADIQLVATTSCTLDGQQIKLGGDAAAFSAVLGELMVAWCNSHIHPIPIGPPGTLMVPADVLSGAVKLKKI